MTTTRYQATWLGALLAVAALCAAGVACAHESPKPTRCSFMYINGDLVVTCPRGTL